MVEFRIRDFLSPRHLLYWRGSLWKSQYYPAEKLRALQWKLLSRLLDHCFNKVPYYRDLFAHLRLHRSDFTSLEDLSLIPILSKDTLFDYQEQFKADDFAKYRPREIHTSGTTGTPLRVYWDLDSNVLELTCMWRHFSWAGWRLGEPFLDIHCRVLDDPGYKWNWKCRGLEMTSSEHSMDTSNIGKYAAILRKYRPKLWRGNPSSIDPLCRLLHEAKIDDVKPRYVFTGGQTLLNHQRSFIESWTGVPVCDSYGLREHNALLCQCPQGGYHIASEYGIVEIIKDDGTPAQEGEEGRVIATGLHNKAFPLLRYDTRDFAIASYRRCSCGRRLPLVGKLIGRTSERLLNTKGRWVYGASYLFDYAQGCRMAQLVQKERFVLEVYLVPMKDYSEKTEAFLRTGLKKALGQGMEIRIHPVKEVPFPSPGKFKLVICKLPG